MVSCCECEGIEGKFSPKLARSNLTRFRRRGPIPSTRILLEELRARVPAGATVLDIGGGIGAIHHTLLDAGAASAVHVDISPSYIEAAREEAARRGHADRVRFVRGDFVERAPELPAADVVTLDRVICCYPDMEKLVELAAARTGRVLGAVYPRATRWVRLGIRIENLVNRVRRSDFRVYAHSPAAIEQALRRHGLERTALRRTLTWEIVTYDRPAPA